MSSNLITADNGVSSGVTGITQSAGSDGTLQLRTTTSGGTATTALTIDNSQKVTFANSIGFGSNAGITFNNSSALTNSTLNDYETGTWTPTFTGSTGAGTVSYSAQYGSYVKIGKMVYLQGRIGISSKSGQTGMGGIGNLPFSPSALNNGSAGTLGYLSNLTYGSGYSQVNLYIPGNSGQTTCNFTLSGTATGAIEVPVANFGNIDMIFNITYQATF